MHTRMHNDDDDDAALIISRMYYLSTSSSVASRLSSGSSTGVTRPSRVGVVGPIHLQFAVVLAEAIVTAQ